MTEKELKIKQIYAEIMDVRIKICKERSTKYGSTPAILRQNDINNLKAREIELVRQLAEEYGLFDRGIN